MSHEIERVKADSFGILKPLVTPDEAVKAFNEYQQLKQKLRGAGDFIGFKDRDGNPKEAPTKQWRSKLTRFFGISTEVVEEQMEYLPDGSFVVKVKARATAPNGLYQEGDGSCWSKTKERYDYKGEQVGDLYHNTRSHAITRAKNRAVLELVGFGEVSAEEIDEDEEGKPSEGFKTKQNAPGKPKPASGNSMSDAQRNFALKLAAHFEKNETKRPEWIAAKYGVDIMDATKAEGSKLIEQLQADIAADREAKKEEAKKQQEGLI